MRIGHASVDSAPLLVSLLTPPGRGALAVVGLVGRDAAAVTDQAFAARGGRPVARREDGAIAFGSWRATGEDLVVVRRRADLVEVHCHGGLAAAAAVAAGLVAFGAEEVAWPRWLASCGESQTVVEAFEALARAGGPKAARILARQAAGALDAEFARIEAWWQAGDPAADAAIARLARASRVGLRLTRPWRAVVAGAVNAGKSSLVNALAGHARCIVSHEAGTTRDLVETRIVLDGWEADLVDTAGLRDADDAAGPVERAGIARAAAAITDADLVLRVWPANGGPPPAVGRGEILVVSKIDVGPPDHRWPAEAVPTSAATGAGIADLTAAIVARLVPEERAEPDLLTGAVPFTPRQVGILGGFTRPRISPTSSGRG
ncbi:MAG: GTPase [Planctomycetaceae bacterium]